MINYICTIFVSVLLLGTCQAADPRISGNGIQPAAPGQFPWQVRLISYDDAGKPRYCTGALIHPQFVLTIVQCLKEKFVVAQLNSTLSSSNSVDVIKMMVDGDFIHPNLTGEEELVNNLAVARLVHPVPLSDYVHPIPLAESTNQIGGGASVRIIGWDLSPDTSNPSLMFGSTKTITNQKCKKYLPQKLIVPGTLCAYGPRSPSQSDGGSGLVQYVDEKPVLVGIFSFVKKGRCNCQYGRPAAYLRVSYYRDWIDSVVEEFIRDK